MAKRRFDVESGGKNVFADLGYPDAKERKLRVELAMHLNMLLGHHGLTQSQIARRLGIRQPHVSDLKRYRLNRFSAERLMEFMVRLGQDVEIRIGAKRGARARATVRVLNLARAGA
jgi:predicted XRE-type DNA-binding protein